VVERGPEKAGVGGSIPSLATIISTTYEPFSQRLRSKTFQLRGGVGLPHVRIARFLAGARLGMPFLISSPSCCFSWTWYPCV
jgi:hypothetical protein